MRDTPLALLAVLGFVLAVLLFTADETLEKITQASIQTRVAAPALATHLTSEPVHAAQPRAQMAPEHPVRIEPAVQVAPEHPVTIEPAAHAARAEAPPTKKRCHPHAPASRVPTEQRLVAPGVRPVRPSVILVLRLLLNSTARIYHVRLGPKCTCQEAIDANQCGFGESSAEFHNKCRHTGT